MQFDKAHKREANDDDRILPLINIVFLLLIFFMIAGQLSASDPFHVSPPASISETKVENNKLVLLVGSDGQLAFDGKVLANENALKQTIKTQSGDLKAPQVWLKVDGQADADKMVMIMEWLRDADLKSVKLLTVAHNKQ